MPPILSNEDREQLASDLAERAKHLSQIREEADFGPGSRVPIGWVLGAGGALVALTVFMVSLYYRVDIFKEEAVTVKYMRLYSKELEAKNENLKAPDAVEVSEMLEKRM